MSDTAASSIESLATLADENQLTCSYDAARRLSSTAAIVACASFEEAVSLMKEGKVQSVLVPAAYTRVRDLLWMMICSARAQALNLSARSFLLESNLVVPLGSKRSFCSRLWNR